MEIKPFDEKSAWMQNSCIQTKIFQEQVIDPIYAHMDADKARSVIAAIWRCEDIGSYKRTTSEEEMQKDLIYDAKFVDKCCLIVTNEQIESGEANKPNKELCPHTDCPKYGPDCWATHSLSPPGMSLALSLELSEHRKNEVQKDWSDIRRWMHSKKMPTPTLATRELEKEFYAKKEQEYRDKGLYP